MKVVVCLTTFNRLDCARILMEIIKLNWPQAWPIVHACSNPDYEPYLEDELVRRTPLPLTTGAMDLLTSSIHAAVTHFDADYVVHLEADTWVFDQKIIEKYVEALADNPHAVIAASSWGVDKILEWQTSPRFDRRVRAGIAQVARRFGSNYGLRNIQTLSTQFFIAKITDVFLDVLRTLNIREDSIIIEHALYNGIMTRCGAEGIIGMREREPVHPVYRNSCDALTLYCHHWPSAEDAPTLTQDPLIPDIDRLRGKRECLAMSDLPHLGPHMQRLLESQDLAYYNGQAKRTS